MTTGHVVTLRAVVTQPFPIMTAALIGGPVPVTAYCPGPNPNRRILLQMGRAKFRPATGGRLEIRAAIAMNNDIRVDLIAEHRDVAPLFCVPFIHHDKITFVEIARIDPAERGAVLEEIATGPSAESRALVAAMTTRSAALDTLARDLQPWRTGRW